MFTRWLDVGGFRPRRIVCKKAVRTTLEKQAWHCVIDSRKN